MNNKDIKNNEEFISVESAESLEESFWKIPTNDEFKKIFAKNLKKARIRAGISQKTLADMMNVPAPTISRYERGLMEPTLSTATLIAESLCCTLDELAGHNELRYGFSAIALQWDKLLMPSMSISYDAEQQSFVITVLKEMETILYKFKAGKKIIIHHTAFSMFEEKIIDFMDKDLYKNKKELAVLYFARMIESIQYSSDVVLPNKDETNTEG